MQIRLDFVDVRRLPNTGALMTKRLLVPPVDTRVLQLPELKLTEALIKRRQIALAHKAKPSARVTLTQLKAKKIELMRELGIFRKK